MGSKKPREIRLEVIRKWLEGNTRDQIAGELEIGAGTVSDTIKGYRRGYLDTGLLREVALNLKSEGLDIQSFAPPLVRLREVLEQKEWLQGVRPGQQQEEENDDDLLSQTQNVAPQQV